MQPLTVAEVAYHVSPDLIDRLVHGLHLLYIEEPDFLSGASVALSVSPIIKVMPVIFLRSQYGAWFRVNSGTRIEIPHAPERLAEHLREVHEITTRMLQEMNTRLGTHLTATTLESHYANAEDFKALRGVVEMPKNYPHYVSHQTPKAVAS